MDALSDANKAIVSNPGNAKAYFRRGNVNNALMYYEEAKYDFVKVKELDACALVIQIIRT